METPIFRQCLFTLTKKIERCWKNKGASHSIDLKRKHSLPPIKPYTTPIQNIPSDNHLILATDRHRFASNDVN
jgi:hypothetical protein